MKVLLLMLAFCGVAQAEMITGQVTGLTTEVQHHHIDAGLPFRFEFSLNTEVTRDEFYADTFNFCFEMYVDGNTYLNQLPSIGLLDSPEVPYQHDLFGPITDSAFVVHYALGADDLFSAAFTIPGLPTEAEHPLMDISLDSITGVSINFTKFGQDPIVSWFAISSPVDVPEPNAVILFLIGIILLLLTLYFKRRL